MPVMNTVIVSSGSQPTPTEKYPIGQILYENNEYKGIVYGHFTDANNNKYALILELYRNTDYNEVIPKTYSDVYCSGSIFSIGVTSTANNELFKDYETATTKCNAIIDYCTANNYTSVVQSVRQESITLDGVTYYGQMPTVNEYLEMLRHSREVAAVADQQPVYGTGAWNLAKYWSMHLSSNRVSSYPWCVGSTQAASAIYRPSASTSANTYVIFEVPIN